MIVSVRIWKSTPCVVRNPQKPLTDSEDRALVTGSKRVVHTLGNSLFLIVESIAKGSSKRFVGR